MPSTLPCSLGATAAAMDASSLTAASIFILTQGGGSGNQRTGAVAEPRSLHRAELYEEAATEVELHHKGCIQDELVKRGAISWYNRNRASKEYGAPFLAISSHEILCSYTPPGSKPKFFCYHTIPEEMDTRFRLVVTQETVERGHLKQTIQLLSCGENVMDNPPPKQLVPWMQLSFPQKTP
ncbi:hypothetical protein TorRG33x02_195180 [Trema orientale]|uniref:Uncharacterized protein n=1 Tax=Trema orientale TaxID=63057 RepID=A0A2P5EGL0_TREOI|nr:hypothetical protein TorRG33x02_195180 [Trema orientale]